MKRRKKPNQPRKPQPAPQKRKPAKAKAAASRPKAATAKSKAAARPKGKVSARGSSSGVTATRRLVAVGNGRYRLGDRTFLPGEGYTIKHVIEKKTYKALNKVIRANAYYLVWDGEKTGSRISKVVADQLQTVAAPGRGKQAPRPKKAAAKKAAPKKAAAKRSAGSSDLSYPHVRSIPKRPGDKK